MMSRIWGIIIVVTKKNFVTLFYGWGSTASRLEPLQGGNLLFTTKFPEIPSTHNYIYLILINWRILQNLKNIPNSTLQVSPRANQFGNKKLRDDLSQRISRIIYTLRSEKYNSVTMLCILKVVDGSWYMLLVWFLLYNPCSNVCA